jgi:flagellar biosynthesis/type III secretory pathway protein FliH
VFFLNINQGHNAPIIQACKTLNGYSAFIAKVREYEEQVAVRADAMKMAIKYCIKNNILKDFLQIHASEVTNMLLTEWNWDDALAVREEEGREEGRKEGLEEGLEEGREEGLEEGQNMVLELLDQGYTPEQIRAKLKTSSTKTAGKT